MVRARNETAEAAPSRKWSPPGVRGLLWGGRAGCIPVFLGQLDEEIVVYQNGGAAFAADPDAPPPPDADFLGRYALVGPPGPETPVYGPVD